MLSPSGSPTIIAGHFGFAIDPPGTEVDTIQAAFDFLPPGRKWASQHIVMSDDGALFERAQQLLSVTAPSKMALALCPMLHLAS